jgi:hypothetical protein
VPPPFAGETHIWKSVDNGFVCAFLFVFMVFPKKVGEMFGGVGGKVVPLPAKLVGSSRILHVNYAKLAGSSCNLRVN